MLEKKIKNENGAIVIEATISLTVFMFAIVTVLLIINICMVQARIACAINATAQEISQYSYIYALTGINDKQADMENEGQAQVENVSAFCEGVNDMYNAIQDLNPKNTDYSVNSFGDIQTLWNTANDKKNELEQIAGSLTNNIETIAKDPKQIIFGIGKLAASGVMDVAKSKLIMEPLATAMCKKHLVSKLEGDVESYLKNLGIVADKKGSYYGGLDFGESMLFPNGSDKITVSVSYDVKVATFLPIIDYSFHFEQTAVTHGWMAGETSHNSQQKKKDKYVENDTLWTEATEKERADYIRTLAFKDLKKEGYNTLAYPYNTDGILYSEEKKEFVMPRSWNPFGDGIIDINDLNEDVMKSYIESLCGTFNSNEFGKTITIKDKDNKKIEQNCDKAAKRIILTIPEDEGLKEKIEKVIRKADTDGVVIELNPGFGNGAIKTKVER